MQATAIAARLKAGFEDLPRQLREAARWVVDHPTDVALLTTREQARRAKIAPATLTRLAQRLGFSGYVQALRSLTCSTTYARSLAPARCLSTAQAQAASMYSARSVALTFCWPFRSNPTPVTLSRRRHTRTIAAQA